MVSAGQNPMPSQQEVDDFCMAAGQWQQRDYALVKAMLDKYGSAIVDREHSNGVGITALMYAANYGEKEIAALLLAHGADVNHKDKRGDTPLMSAAWYTSNKDTILLLLEKGAVLDEKNDEGKTALMIAMENRKDSETDIAALIELWEDVRDFSVALKHDVPAPRPFSVPKVKTRGLKP